MGRAGSLFSRDLQMRFLSRAEVPWSSFCERRLRPFVFEPLLSACDAGQLTRAFSRFRVGFFFFTFM